MQIDVSSLWVPFRFLLVRMNQMATPSRLLLFMSFIFSNFPLAPENHSIWVADYWGEKIKGCIKNSSVFCWNAARETPHPSYPKLRQNFILVVPLCPVTPILYNESQRKPGFRTVSEGTLGSHAGSSLQNYSAAFTVVCLAHAQKQLFLQSTL